MKHSHLIQLAHSLGYHSINNTGLCNGFSNMWIQAACNEDLPAFSTRLNILEEFSKNPATLSNEIQRIRNLVKNNKNYQFMLNQREMIILEIPAFFDGLSLYQEPGKATELFNERLSQREVYKISEYTKSQQSKEGLIQSKTIVDSYNKDELRKFLIDLAQQLEEKPNVAINFHSSNHSVAARYLGNNQFEFIDTNFNTEANSTLTPKILDIEQLGDALEDAFKVCKGESNILLIATQLVTSKANQIENFKRMDSSRTIIDLKADQTGTNLLHLAIIHSDKEIINKMDFNQVNLIKADGEGISSLSRAIQAMAVSKSEDSKDIFNKLLSSPSINVNPADSNASFPVSEAIDLDEWNIARKMIDHFTFNPQIIDKHDSTYLHTASKKNGFNALEMSRLLINKGANINAKDKSGGTPLIYATWRGDMAMVNLFLENQADVNHRDKYGKSALNYSCAQGNIELTRLLLKKDKTACNQKSNDGQTPLDIACVSQSKEFIELLLPHTTLHLDNFSSTSPMLQAMENCSWATQKLYVKKILEAYIATRQNEGNSFFDNFGYSKTDKITAATTLLKQINNPEFNQFDKRTLDIIQNGRLGEIYKFYNQHNSAITPNSANFENKTSCNIKGQLEFKANIAKMRESKKNEENQIAGNVEYEKKYPK